MNKPRGLGKARRVIAEIGYALYSIAAIISFVLMLWIVLAGLSEVFLALREHSLTTLPGTGAADDTILNVLEGFELLLLAPIVFVITATIGQFLTRLLAGDVLDEESGRGLHRVKALIGTLLLSVVAADLVRRFLRLSEASPQTFAIGGALILLLLLIVAFLLNVRESATGAREKV